MKFRISAALLLAALSIPPLSGCAVPAAAPAPTGAPVLTVMEEPSVPLAPVPQTMSPTVPPVSTEALAATEAQAAPADPARITKEEAIAIALNHAGLTGEQVIYRRAEFDWDNGRPIYEIDFHSGDREYDYDIDAETGDILEKESEPDRLSKSDPAPTEAPAATEAPAQSTERLTGDEATAIALKDAGLAQDQVTRLEAEFDCDDGRPEYDVSFHQGGYEYDYEIHAETGKILSRDKEWDD